MEYFEKKNKFPGVLEPRVWLLYCCARGVSEYRVFQGVTCRFFLVFFFLFQTRVRIGKVRAGFADGIDETEGAAETADAAVETQPNDDGHQLQNAYGVAGETLLLDHNIRTAQLRRQMFLHQRPRKRHRAVYRVVECNVKYGITGPVLGPTYPRTNVSVVGAKLASEWYFLDFFAHFIWTEIFMGGPSEINIIAL